MPPILNFEIATRREQYLSKIRGFYHDTDIIKVITGVRRCGKSSLMEMIVDALSISNEIKYFFEKSKK